MSLSSEDRRGRVPAQTDFVDAGETLMIHALKSLPRKNQKFVCKVGDVVYTAWPNMKVYADPQLVADVVCVLFSRVYLRVLEIHERVDKLGKTLVWLHADCGWILASDGGENPFANVIDNIEEAETNWRLEEAKKQRIASAVASMLVRSYSLPRCIRLARSIMKHALTYYPETNLTKITDEIMENIMIILGGQTALTKQKVFEYIKAAAARQSNPKKAVVDISQEIFDTISKRPSLWVKEDLNVIITEEGQRRYDKFVMAAAMGDIETFQYFLNNNQELTSLHSQLHYTALHAAAEFGKVEIIQLLISTGLSLDIRDPVRGQTALHFAAYAGRSEVVLALFEGGANRQIVCYNGIYPFQAADKQGHVDCREILKFLPPSMSSMRLVDETIDSISLSWNAPILNRTYYAKIREYQIVCQCTEELHPDTQKSIADPVPIITSSTSCVFNHLVSACEYRCRIRCKSVSGWSDWSDWLYARTRSYIPDTPASPEIRKITINALYLNWYKPIRTNGEDIDFYEIELRDNASIEQIAQQTAALVVKYTKEKNPSLVFDSDNMEDFDHTAPSFSPSSTAMGSRKKSDSLVAQQGGVSKLHRIMKHKDVNHLYKCLTGLEPGRLYRTRLRAHNAMGFSGWSLWTPPVAPQVGVKIVSFINESKSVEMSWFEPILSEIHHIDCYELQLCKVLAPRSVSLHSKQYNEQRYPELLLPKRKQKTKNPLDFNDDDNYFDDEYTLELRRREEEEEAARWKEEEEKRAKENEEYLKNAKNLTTGGSNEVEAGGMNEDFHTIASNITTNAFTLTQLKAGGRYVVRVRTKLREEEHWMAWEFALRSDTFSTPASIPDPPLRVQPRRRMGRPKKEVLRPLSPETKQTRATLQEQSLSYSFVIEHQAKNNKNDDNHRRKEGNDDSEEDDIFPLMDTTDVISNRNTNKKPKTSSTKKARKIPMRESTLVTVTNFSGYTDDDILVRKPRGFGSHDSETEEEETEDDRSLSWWRNQIAANEAAILDAESSSHQASSNPNGTTTLSSVMLHQPLTNGNNKADSYSLAASSTQNISLASIVPDIPALRRPNQHEPLPLSFYQASTSSPSHITTTQQQCQLFLRTQPYSDTLVLPREDEASQRSSFLTMHPAMGHGMSEAGGDNGSLNFHAPHTGNFDMAEFLATASMASASITATLPYERDDSFMNGDESQADHSRIRSGMNMLTAPGMTAQEELATQSAMTGEPIEEDAQTLTDLWDITHDRITITWTPGEANGENLCGCEIQMAKVKTYDHQDVLCARDAFLGLHYDEKRQEQLLEMALVTTSPGEIEDMELKDGSDHNQNYNITGGLEWETVNNRGVFTSPNSFQVHSLTPGGVYNFRVRIQNRIGWSRWSKASPMIATYPSVAPNPPTIVFVKATFSVVVWEEVQFKQSQLTTLENQLQICTVAQQKSKNSESLKISEEEEDEDWRLVSASRQLGQKEMESFLGFLAKEYTGKNISGAMIERLVEGRFYKVRVRVRTVVGWSPWSESSDLFRTMS